VPTLTVTLMTEKARNSPQPSVLLMVATPCTQRSWAEGGTGGAPETAHAPMAATTMSAMPANGPPRRTPSGTSMNAAPVSAVGAAACQLRSPKRRADSALSAMAAAAGTYTTLASAAITAACTACAAGHRAAQAFSQEPAYSLPRRRDHGRMHGLQCRATGDSGQPVTVGMQAPNDT
jgi:hypothetical protein